MLYLNPKEVPLLENRSQEDIGLTIMPFAEQIKTEITSGINVYFHKVYPHCEDYPAAMAEVFIIIRKALLKQFERELEREIKLFTLDQVAIDVLISNTKEYLKQ